MLMIMVAWNVNRVAEKRTMQRIKLPLPRVTKTDTLRFRKQQRRLKNAERLS